jgi:hypothetical protein
MYRAPASNNLSIVGSIPTGATGGKSYDGRWLTRHHHLTLVKSKPVCDATIREPWQRSVSDPSTYRMRDGGVQGVTSENSFV